MTPGWRTNMWAGLGIFSWSNRSEGGRQPLGGGESTAGGVSTTAESAEEV